MNFLATKCLKNEMRKSNVNFTCKHLCKWIGLFTHLYTLYTNVNKMSIHIVKLCKIY